MDPLHLIIEAIAGFLAAGAITMLFRNQASLFRGQAKLSGDIGAVRESLPLNYVQKVDYKDDIKEVKESLREVLLELRNKKDKHDE
jgi:hypothetical protein